jgi:hypothetical protein
MGSDHTKLSVSSSEQLYPCPQHLTASQAETYSEILSNKGTVNDVALRGRKNSLSLGKNVCVNYIFSFQISRGGGRVACKIFPEI